MKIFCLSVLFVIGLAFPAFAQTILPCIKYDPSLTVTLTTSPCVSGSDLSGYSGTGTYVYAEPGDRTSLRLLVL